MIAPAELDYFRYGASRAPTPTEYDGNQYQTRRAGACSRRKTKEWQNRLTYEVRLCLERTVGDASPYEHNYNPHQAVGTGVPDGPKKQTAAPRHRPTSIIITHTKR